MYIKNCLPIVSVTPVDSIELMFAEVRMGIRFILHHCGLLTSESEITPYVLLGDSFSTPYLVK